jgi:hypothetical protein
MGPLLAFAKKHWDRIMNLIPASWQWIASLILIPIFILLVNKISEMKDLEREAFNTSYRAESRAANADYKTDKLKDEIFYIQIRLKDIPMEADSLEYKIQWRRNQLIEAVQRGWTTVESANCQISELNDEMIALHNKFQECQDRLPILESELQKEKTKAEIEAERILEEGKKAEEQYYKLKNSIEYYVAPLFLCGFLLFIFCPPFRWLLYLILFMLTLGKISELIQN